MELAIIGDANFEKIFDTVEVEKNYKIAQLDGKDCAFLCANNNFRSNLEIIKTIGANKILEITKNEIDDAREEEAEDSGIEYTGFSVKGVDSYIKPIIRAALISTTDTVTSKSILTAREEEVLSLVASGLANKDIAKKLYLSEKTVKNHLNTIFKKIGVTDRTNAALYAVKMNGGNAQ